MEAMKQIIKIQHILLTKHTNKISGAEINKSMDKQFVFQLDGKSMEEVILIVTKVTIYYNIIISLQQLMKHYSK